MKCQQWKAQDAVNEWNKEDRRIAEGSSNHQTELKVEVSLTSSKVAIDEDSIAEEEDASNMNLNRSA